MADFLEAVQHVLANEGGYVNNPADPGGETNFGISKRSYPALDIRDLTREQAIEIYRSDYWQFSGLQSQRVATKVFDLAVNMGPIPAVRLLQLSLGAIQAGPVVADGQLGPRTISAANAADEGRLMDELKARACLYHSKLDRSDFLLGWLRRDVKG